MKKYKNTLYYKELFIMTVFLFSVEMIFRVVLNFAIFDWASLRILLSCFLFSTILSFIGLFCKKKKVREIIFGVFLFVSSCYAWAQAGFNNFLGMFISVGTSGQAGAVATYIKNFFLSFKWQYYLLFIPFLLWQLYYFLPRKTSRETISKFTWKERCGSIISFCLISAAYLSTLYAPFMQNSLQLVENKKLFFAPTNSSIAINQFGTIMFGALDIKQTILPVYLPADIVDSEKKEENTRKFDDTSWESIIAEENDSTNNLLNRYFINRPISKKNEYTGYFAGKNVIVIMMESINNAILKEEYFPNFSKMLKHSWYWENNYSPRNTCATGDNEFSGMTSLYPLNSSCTVNTYPNNKYPYAIFNSFAKKGYTTSSFHDFDSTFYNRKVFHKNMGSMEYYDMNRLKLKYAGDLPSDIELMEKSTPIFTKKSPFMVWMTTVTAHLPYDSETYYGKLYYDLFKDTNYTDSLKHYLSRVKVTDDALGALMKELKAKDMLDDTVIVLYGDHYPYGLSNSDVKKIVDYDIDDFYEIERTPFLIYNSKIEPKVFQEKTFYMNILPTLANLFDLNYDPRFYLGEDLFDENFSSRVIFVDGSWEDKIARYQAVDATITYFDESITYSEEEIQKINYDIYQKKEMSKIAITSNYFEYLDKKLKEKAVEKQEEKHE